jgi:hypothetical protein
MIVANQLETTGAAETSAAATTSASAAAALPPGVTTGGIAPLIVCARDKGWAMRALAGPPAASSGRAGCSVYVGDSLTDLAALLQVCL